MFPLHPVTHPNLLYASPTVQERSKLALPGDLTEHQKQPLRDKRTRFSDVRLLWQCREMPKAYRTDVVGHQKFAGEIGKSKNAVKSERVRCPVGGCECSYEMYGIQSSSRDRDIATLQERIQREHPGHTSEVLAVNAFRRPR